MQDIKFQIGFLISFPVSLEAHWHLRLPDTAPQFEMRFASGELLYHRACEHQRSIGVLSLRVLELCLHIQGRSMPGRSSAQLGVHNQGVPVLGNSSDSFALSSQETVAKVYHREAG